MKTTLAAVFAFCFIAASAYEIRRDNSAPEKAIDAESKVIGAEAILVGQVLRYAARELEQDETLNNELDEYFFRKLFGTLKEGVKKVGEVAGEVVAGVAKGAITAVVNAVKEHGFFSMEQNVMEKATKLLTTIVDKTAASYSYQDSQKAEAFVKQVSSHIDAVGLRLIERGQELLGLYDIDF